MSAEPEQPLLGPTQRSVVGFAITLVALLASAAALVAAFAVLGSLAAYFSGVLWPLAVAGVFAMVLRPVVSFFELRLKVRRLVAVILLFGLFLLAMSAVLQWLLPPLVIQLLDFVGDMGVYSERALKSARENYPQWVEFVQNQLKNPYIRQIVDQLSTSGRAMLAGIAPSIQATGGGVLGVFGFFAHLAIIPVYLFFFLLSRHDPFRNLGSHLTFLREGVRDDVVFLVREFVAIVESFFRGQLIIGLTLGVLMAIGFTLVGLQFGLFIGLILGVLNIVPYLGTIIGLIITLPLAYLQQDGGVELVALVLLVMIIVQCTDGWYLTPKIMGGRTGLHPVIIIIAIFFWGTAFNGLLGMVLAIPLTAFFVTAWRLLLRKYFPHTASGQASH